MGAADNLRESGLLLESRGGGFGRTVEQNRLEWCGHGRHLAVKISVKS